MKINVFLKEKIFDRLWYRILCFCTVPVFIFMCLLCLEYMNYRTIRGAFALWRRNTGALILAFIVLSLISLIILLLVRKLWIYATVLGSVSVIVGIINCVKLAVNGDYFFPWDISMAKNMGELVSFARFDLPPYIWAFIPMIAIACVLYALSGAEIPVKWYFRVPAALALSCIFVVFYNMPKKTEKVLENFGMSFNDSILQSSNYYANGFVNAFSINFMAQKVTAPEGYSEQNINSYLAPYEDKSSESEAGNETTNEDEVKPDVIVILSEAFYDITTLENTEFSADPLSRFREISSRENAYSGKLVTSALGGGTVRTEFEILTGCTVDYLTNGTSPYMYVTKDVETYVSNYKEQGYFTKGIHTYDGSFYMRNVAYPYIGFDEFASEAEIALRDDATWRRRYLTDDTFMNEVIDTLESHTDTPNFIFGITMENHQGYEKSAPEDIVIEVSNDKLSGANLDSVVTYTQGVYYADAALGKLVDYVDSREKETIILFFGDHLPTLGSNQGAYNQAGNVDASDGYDFDEKMYLYSTPFLFYANYDIDYNSTMNQAEYVSSYYMLTLLADMTGTKMTPYMQYLRDSFDVMPFYNVRLGANISTEGKDITTAMKLITYDRIKGAEYSVKKDYP